MLNSIHFQFDTVDHMLHNFPPLKFSYNQLLIHHLPRCLISRNKWTATSYIPLIKKWTDSHNTVSLRVTWWKRQKQLHMNYLYYILPYYNEILYYHHEREVLQNLAVSYHLRKLEHLSISLQIHCHSIHKEWTNDCNREDSIQITKVKHIYTRSVRYGPTRAWYCFVWTSQFNPL